MLKVIDNCCCFQHECPSGMYLGQSNLILIHRKKYYRTCIAAGQNIARARFKKCASPALQRQLHYFKVVFLNVSIVNNVSGMSGFCSLCISIFPAHFFNHRPNCILGYSRHAVFCGNSEFTDSGFTCEWTRADVTSLSLKNSPQAQAYNTRL